MSSVVLLGGDVASSLSPALHNAAFAALGMPHRYVAVSVGAADLPAAVERIRREDILGANVTIPHKTAAVRLVDAVGEEARRIGAINTIVRRGSRLVGENTDRYGFAMGLAEADVATGGRGLLVRQRVLVLGAGGAARAVVVALLEREDDVVVASRHRRSAEDLVRALGGAAGAALAAADWPRPGEPLRADAVVNATPLGTLGEDPLAGIPLPAVVVDIVPTAAPTPLVTRAREAHHVAVVDGLAMLLHQAARSFELWTGAPAPIAVMRAALPRPS